MQSTKIRILLVDDQPAVLKGLKMLFALESDFQIVAEASDGPTAVKRVVEIRPDVVVMDLELPGMDGIDAARALLQFEPGTIVIMLSIRTDPTSQRRAREAGVVAFVEKRDGAGRLMREIRAACSLKE